MSTSLAPGQQSILSNFCLFSNLIEENLYPCVALLLMSLTVTLACLLDHMHFLFCEPPMTSAHFSAGPVVFLAFISESASYVLENNTFLCREVQVSPLVFAPLFPTLCCALVLASLWTLLLFTFAIVNLCFLAAGF